MIRTIKEEVDLEQAKAYALDCLGKLKGTLDDKYVNVFAIWVGSYKTKLGKDDKTISSSEELIHYIANAIINVLKINSDLVQGQEQGQKKTLNTLKGTAITYYDLNAEINKLVLNTLTDGKTWQTKVGDNSINTAQKLANYIDLVSRAIDGVQKAKYVMN
ncbi:35997_t:CDS:2 [Gigaspora margarita]|uniref:35997_t:CDS:1 n=1 Tax=Gigaspora margarita TaxID=4874 RepID=A0ABN7VDT6_GIGMA|nr:35997_t:CDS:2 [Gigaspora margarita]